MRPKKQSPAPNFVLHNKTEQTIYAGRVREKEREVKKKGLAEEFKEMPSYFPLCFSLLSHSLSLLWSF